MFGQIADDYEYYQRRFAHISAAASHICRKNDGYLHDLHVPSGGEHMNIQRLDPFEIEDILSTNTVLNQQNIMELHKLAELFVESSDEL